MIKKLLVLLLCITFVCPTVWADDYDEMYFEKTEYIDAVTFLSEIGIISGEDEFVNTDVWTVTRGEFLSYALKCIDLKSLAMSMEVTNPFSDVAEDYAYKKEIAFAMHSKFLGNDFGLLFKPDEPLTADFAARIGTCITGREVLVRENNSYLSVAQTAKLFKNVDFYDGNKINRGNALNFLKNVLTSNLMTVTTISADSSSRVELDKDKTVISHYLGLEKREGIVTSDGRTTIYGNRAKAGYVSIDGEKYIALCTDYVNMAGKKVEYYVKYDGTEVMVHSIEEAENKILTLDANMIESFDSVTASFTAYVDGSSENLKISRDAYISYNFEPDYSPELMKPNAGFVTLIDHDDNNVYDAVMVQEFTNTVTEYYSNYSEIIYDAEDSNFDIDLNAFNDYEIIDLLGKPVEPENIKQYSIISVYKNNSKGTAYLIVSDTKKSGVLNSFKIDEGVCTFGDTEYKLSKSVRFKDELSAGKSYDLYFDSLGEICYITTDKGTMAYIVQGENKDEPFNDKVLLQVLPEDTKKLTVYTLADKVSVTRPMQNEKTVRAEDIYADILLKQDGSFNSQMSLISLNGKGEINKIVFAKEISTYSELMSGEEYPLYNLAYLVKEWPEILKDGDYLRYRSGVGGFNRWVILANGAQMFYVPKAGEAIEDPDSVIVKPTSYGGDDTEKLSELTYYSKDRDDVSVRYLVKQATAQDESSFGTISPGFVTDVRMVYDKKLGATWRIVVSGMSSDVSYLVKDESVLLSANVIGNNIRKDKTRIEVGDLVKCLTDEAGNVKKISLLWDAKAGINDEYNDNGDTAPRFGALTIDAQTSWNQGGWSVVAGNIERKSENVLEFTVDKTSTLQTFMQRLQRVMWGKGNRVLLIDYSDKKVKVTLNASASELVKGDRIVISTYSGQTYNVVAYRR